MYKFCLKQPLSKTTVIRSADMEQKINDLEILAIMYTVVMIVCIWIYVFDRLKNNKNE